MSPTSLHPQQQMSHFSGVWQNFTLPVSHFPGSALEIWGQRHNFQPGCFLVSSDTLRAEKEQFYSFEKASFFIIWCMTGNLHFLCSISTIWHRREERDFFFVLSGSKPTLLSGGPVRKQGEIWDCLERGHYHVQRPRFGIRFIKYWLYSSSFVLQFWSKRKANPTSFSQSTNIYSVSPALRQCGKYWRFLEKASTPTEPCNLGREVPRVPMTGTRCSRVLSHRVTPHPAHGDRADVCSDVQKSG